VYPQVQVPPLEDAAAAAPPLLEEPPDELVPPLDELLPLAEEAQSGGPAIGLPPHPQKTPGDVSMIHAGEHEPPIELQAAGSQTIL
jgi:hypothetical protein